MVVLEGMQYGVPTVYSKSSGVAEVIQAGIRVRPQEVERMAEELHRLWDLTYWNSVRESQRVGLEAYTNRGDERTLLDLWSRLARTPARPRSGQ